MEITLLSPAKINLFLSITSQRCDGYHNLETLFQLLEVSDKLILSKSNLPPLLTSTLPTVKLSYSDQTKLNPFTQGLCSHPEADNLIVKAAYALANYAKKNQLDAYLFDVEILIDKILPMGAGLGGGSSNAAMTLLGLNHLWQLALDKQTLSMIGLGLGADVPIFIEGKSAFATGVGEKIMPVTLDEAWYLLIFPNISIPTAKLFQDPELIRNAPIRQYAQWLNTPYYNVFEPIARKHYPSVNDAITWLSEYTETRMTGTGSTVFAKFATQAEATQLLCKLPKSWWAVVTRGMNELPNADTSIGI